MDARFDANDPQHDRANSLFAGVGTGNLLYRLLYTSSDILDELATLILSHRDHTAALNALERVIQSPVTVVHPDEADFNATHEQFARYDAHGISFTDYMTGVLATARDIEHIFTFDADHFRTLGYTVVPADTGEG